MAHSDIKVELKKRFDDSKNRRLELLRTGHLSDCQFLVGKNNIVLDDEKDDGALTKTWNPETDNEPQKLFLCHKMVLATASEVFERQFYGEFKDQPTPICLTDISPDSFRIFLDYIYIYQLLSSDVNMKNISELLYLSEKYMMDDFASKCIECMKERKWNVADIIPLFDISCLYSNLQFMLVCYEKIRRAGIKLLNHYTFYQMNPKNIKRLIVFLNQLRTIKSNVILEALERYVQVNGICQTCNPDDLICLIDAAKTLRLDDVVESEMSYLLKLGKLSSAE